MKENNEGRTAARRKRAMIGLAVTSIVLGVSTTTLAVLYGISQSELNNNQTQLENVYKRNMYDLIESINNAETKISKVLSSTGVDYQNKMLVEVAHDADLAQQSISSLPISPGNLNESVKFINQVSGYTSTLSKELSKGNKLSEDEKETLSKIQISLSSMKEELGKMLDEVKDGNFSILEESNKFTNDISSFTIRINKIKTQDVDYPAMIYDGPFSDSETNVDIKGLTGSEVSVEKAEEELRKSFKDVSEVTYLGEINSRFETYNFKAMATTENTIYAQVTKINGNILTVSGASSSLDLNSMDVEDAKEIAIQFARENGIKDATCVWKDVLRNEAYFNIAPKEKGIILYPDLVKVKVDLMTGTVIGYDASSYFTNHTNRLLSDVGILEGVAEKALPEGYNFEKARLVLAPLEYGREVLCYEFVGEKEGDTYYFYINAESGILENVLKVIETTDGSKLM